MTAGDLLTRPSVAVTRLVLAAVLLLVAWAPASADGEIFLVNKSGDGPFPDCTEERCNLRAAILAANATPGLDRIHFDIGGAPRAINVKSPLPTITDPIVIDGTTQAGYGGSPMIAIEGDGAGGEGNGLHITAGGSTVRALAISGFRGAHAGGSGLRLSFGGGNRVEGMWIGTDLTGQGKRQNDNGIVVHESAGNVIGGTTPETRNVISGNRRYGVLFLAVQPAPGNRLIGNHIGIAADVRIGGTAPGEGNVIAFNAANGVTVFETGVAILGNRIFANARVGIDLAPQQAAEEGVTVNDVGDGDAGGNHLQNFPLLSSATVGTQGIVRGALHSEELHDYRLEVFANEACDADGHGEGRDFLGAFEVSTDRDGDAPFAATLDIPPDVVLTATATATDITRIGEGFVRNDTSEFSPCVAVQTAEPAIPAIFTVTTTSDADDGRCDVAHCSLREAIHAANAQAGLDRIAFKIDGEAPHTIRPQAPLPIVTDPAEIDGTSQPGYAGTPVVELDGSVAGTEVNGLHITAGGSTVRGLGIVNFLGLDVGGSELGGAGIRLENSGGNLIVDNHIGTDPSGTTARGNENGIVLIESGGNQIGGTDPASRNLISGNSRY